ncbi:MAG: hypothetical protein ACYDGR_03430 [Candidatus Dormibacteria bacterium]
MVEEVGETRGITCVVTIHGIGFQEPPRPEQPSGYADGLHANLRAQNAGVSDDPGRQSWQTAATVPIYVSSRYPASGGTRAEGLKRLGVWVDKFGAGTIDHGSAPLVAGDATIAHVALVYAELEDIGPQPVASAETLLRAVAEHGHYGSVLSTLHSLLLDGAAALLHTPSPSTTTTASRSSMRPRSDAGRRHRHLPHLWSEPTDPAEPGGILGTLTQLEDDVCGYVCRNDLRERIRSFVREALLRLAARDDVARIVINSHSNGTVIAFDTLRALPGPVFQKVDTLVTAGSPLRKYAALFAWGTEVGNIRHLKNWSNYFDPRDPVANPLTAQASDPFVSQPPDATAPTPFAIGDVQVDNVAHSSGGGLQAHNYWDNTSEFISPLARLL